MFGDKVLIEAHHRNAANTISTFVLSKLNQDKSKKAICVAGESGSGKSEIATEISLILKKMKCLVSYYGKMTILFIPLKSMI